MKNKWLSHKFNLAADDILQYKMHILRAIHQDHAKTDLMEKLSERRALIIFDFAMKFLPQKYREAQVDFFGKKGKGCPAKNLPFLNMAHYCLLNISNYFSHREKMHESRCCSWGGPLSHLQTSWMRLGDFVLIRTDRQGQVLSRFARLKIKDTIINPCPC